MAKGYDQTRALVSTARFLTICLVGLSVLIFPSIQCATDDDCNLNGICDASSGICQCDLGWTATDCGVLDIIPGSRNNGYNQTGDGLSSWGSKIVQDPQDPDQYHSFIAEFTHGCGLEYWTPYSRIIRAESRTGPIGPFVFAAEVVEVFAHNPTVIYSPADQLYLLYYIGCPIQVADGCQSMTFTCGPGDEVQGESGISVQASENLVSWQPYGMVFPGLDEDVLGADTTNPSPLAACNASCCDSHEIYLAYTGLGPNATIGSATFLATTQNFTGPYTRFDQGSSPLYPAPNEDPFLWQDKRGNYHMLMHAWDSANGSKETKVGRHAYSRSITGPWTKNYNTTAYTTAALYDDGTEIVFSRRERPQLFFSDNGEMTPLYLTNGVQEFQTEMSYSQVFPINST